MGATSILNHRGFSLPGVLVAVGIISIVAAGTASLFTDIARRQNHMQYRMQSDVVHEEIRAILSNEAACAATLGAQPLSQILTGTPPLPITAIRNSTGAVTHQLDTPYGDSSTSITRIRFIDYAESSPPSGEGTLELTMVSPKEAAGGQIRPRTINIRTARDPSGTLTTCIATAKMTDGIWRRVTANINDVFFEGGNVGVGTTTPQYKFHLSGEDENTAFFVENRSSSVNRYPSVSVTNYASSSAGFPLLQFAKARGTANNPQPVVAGDIIGQILAFGGAGNTPASVFVPGERSAAISFLSDAAHTGTSKPGAILLSTTPVGQVDALERMRITSSGRVGIGTDAPTTDVQVVGRDTPIVGLDVMNEGGPSSQFTNVSLTTFSTTGHSGLNLYRGRGTRASPQSVRADDLLGAWASWGWGGGQLVGSSIGSPPAAIGMWASADFTANSAPTYMTFATSAGPVSGGAYAQERVRITASGFVGIGTTQPVHNLHVAGNGIAISNPSAPLNNIFQFFVETGDVGVINYGHLTGGVPAGRLDFRSEEVTRVSILNNGNVGIGTTNPSYQLELSSDSAAKPGTSYWTTHPTRDSNPFGRRS